jgi:MFS family permease
MAGEEATAASLIGRLERLKFSRWHRNLVILAATGVLLDAADFALFGAALPGISKEFGFGPAQAGLLATVGLIGAFVGALFWGTISDYIGRRTAFAATIGIFAVFTGLVAAAWNVVSLGVFRFLSNFGLGGEIPVALTITAEFMPSRIRGRVSSGVLAAFPLGLALAAGLSLLILPTYGWRVLFLIGVLPAFILFFVRRYMPESVRYLISRGRHFFVGAGFHLWFAEASGIWSYVAIGLVGLVNPGVYGSTGVYVGELFPTHLRATAVGWFFGIGRIGSFLAPAVVGLMLAYGLGHYVLHTFALTFLLASFAVIAIGIETKGRVLEEISATAH